MKHVEAVLFHDQNALKMKVNPETYLKIWQKAAGLFLYFQEIAGCIVLSENHSIVIQPEE